ncbi:MAG TPA: N-acetylneuraminate synthase family protein [Melioribacteraceae bacterium]|nr:N-acetylneuraminate synthase family protein [Melioribacteraceae bacterium]
MIICEVGLNHLGNENYAYSYIDAILKTKADAITFQIREPDYYINGREKLLLSDRFYRNAAKMIKSGNKKFGIALADANKIDFFNEIKIDFFKVIRNDINNFVLLNRLIESNASRIYVSTGMSSLEEIDEFISKFKKFISRITLVHTQISHDINKVNLKVINTLKGRYSIPIAFGNHCANLKVVFLSTAFLPTDIFIYVKSNESSYHPDEEHAVRLEELNKFISDLIVLPDSIGDGLKKKMGDERAKIPYEKSNNFS